MPRPDLPTTETSDPLASTIASIAGAMSRAREHKSTLDAGEVANLRRMDPEDPSCAAFWKVLARWQLPYLSGGDGPERDESERRWACVLACMADMNGQHTPSAHLGRALAQADLSDARFEALMRARGAALRELLRRAIHLMSSRGVPSSLVDLARFVLSEADEERAERQRRRLARGFYAVFESKESSK